MSERGGYGPQQTVVRLLIAWLVVASHLMFSPEVPAYDLGGPCVEKQGLPYCAKTTSASGKKEWDQAVQCRKAAVRDMCSNPYRWYSLLLTLIGANRLDDAIEVVEEMDRRALEPELSDPILRSFMQSTVFRESAVGRKFANILSAADARHARVLKELEALPANRRPLSKYVSKGSCPFECCTYRTWGVQKDTLLVDRPNGKKTVGKAIKGSKVVGVTGEVHLEPAPVVVVAYGSELDDLRGLGAPEELSTGHVIYLLDYMGEGHYRYWFKGKEGEEGISGSLRRYCFYPNLDCWGEYIGTSPYERKTAWWVKIRLSSGIEGWSDKPDNFDNIDACG